MRLVSDKYCTLFLFDIEENFAALGMEGGAIQDCQISASSAGTPPADARPGLNGWSSAESRGPPLFKNEYIQVRLVNCGL